MRIRSASVALVGVVALAGTISAAAIGPGNGDSVFEPAARQRRPGTDLLVSQGLSGPNHFPAAAVNSTNGDILVVWRYFDGANTSLQGRVYERQPDGSHHGQSIFEVSDGAPFNNSPDVQWVDWLKRYVVVWDTTNMLALEPTTIQAAEINVAGKVTKQRTIIKASMGRTNLFPRLGVAPGRKELLLSFTALPNTAGDRKTGLVLTALNSKLKARGKKFYLLPPGVNGGAASEVGARAAHLGFDHLNFVPIGQQNSNEPGLGFGGVLETARWFDDDGNPNSAPRANPFTRNQSTWLLTQDANGKLGVTVQNHGPRPAALLIPAPSDPEGLGAARRSMFVRGTFQAGFLDDVFDGDLDGYLLLGDGDGSIDGSYLPRNYDDGTPAHNQDLPLRRSRARRADAQFAHLVTVNGKFVQTQPLIWTGPPGARTLGIGTKVTRLFNTKNKLAWLATASGPDQGVKVVVWTKTKGAKSEIRIHIYE